MPNAASSAADPVPAPRTDADADATDVDAADAEADADDVECSEAELVLLSMPLPPPGIPAAIKTERNSAGMSGAPTDGQRKNRRRTNGVLRYYRDNFLRNKVNRLLKRDPKFFRVRV